MPVNFLEVVMAKLSGYNILLLYFFFLILCICPFLLNYFKLSPPAIFKQGEISQFSDVFQCTIAVSASLPRHPISTRWSIPTDIDSN